MLYIIFDILIRLPLKHRSAFAKFRCGVAPIRIETGRYEGLDFNSRTCPLCRNAIEDENMSFLIVHSIMISDNSFSAEQRLLVQTL